MSEQHDIAPSQNNTLRTGIETPVLLTAALFLVLVWGSAFTLIGVAVRTISPQWLVAYRMTFGAGLVLAYCLMKGYRLPPIKDGRWAWYLSMGLTGASLPFVLIAVGQKTVDSGLTAILVGTMPLMTVVLAHIFTDEKLNFWKSLGFVLGFFGIIILFLPTEISLDLVSDWKAQLLILGAAFCYASTTIIAARAPETPSAVGAAMMLLAGAAMSMIWAIGTAGPAPIPDLTVIICILVLGIGSTGIATVTYLWLIDEVGPSVIAKINYLVPICSVVLGVTFLSEPLDWRIFVSLAVIILGLMIARKGR